MMNLLQSQQTRGVTSQDALLAFVGNIERLNAFHHLGNAADLMRIIAACQNMIDSGKRDGKLNRVRVEVDGIVIKILEISAGSLHDVLAALAEGVKSAIQPFCEIRNCAPEMSQDPA